MPRDEGNVVYRVNDGPFKMCHHLEVVIVLDVVALEDCDLPINDHEFGMKGSKKWAMIIDNL